jgi:cysteine desulfurase
MMSLSAHKAYGPKGVGALVVGRNVDLKPLIVGAGHEKGLRAGTENVPGIVGFGMACDMIESMAGETVRSLRERLWAALTRSSMG